MRTSGVFWAGFFSLILLSWSILLLWDLQPAFLHDWGFLHLHHAHDNLPIIILMWVVMVMGMMLPTIMPLLLHTHALLRQNSASFTSLWGLVVGYVIIWLGFAIPAGILQFTLQHMGFADDTGTLTSRFAMSGMLLLAGIYQFSPLKQACLNKCRQPTAFMLSHWRAGSRGMMRLGFLHGAFCLGCCWALMMLAFVAGTMNTIGMGIAMLVMTCEKLPVWGKYLDLPLGLLLTCTGLIVLFYALAS